MARNCKKCYMPLGPDETECANCGAYNPLAVQIEPAQEELQKEPEKEPEKSNGVVLIVTAVVLILVAILGIGLVLLKPVEEVEYTHNVSVGDPAYINVKSILPKYVLSNGVGGYEHSTVCRCTTTAGDTVWLYIKILDYNEYIDAEARLKAYFAEFDEVEFPAGTVIHGRVREADKISADLSKEIGTDRVLEFESLETK